MLEIILDASQLEVFESCPYKWYLDHKLNLTTKKPNPALSTGSYFHAVLKHYYSGKQPLSGNVRETLELAKELAYGPEASKWPKVRSDPKFYLNRLFSYFLNRVMDDDDMDIIAVEKGFSWLLYEDAHRRYILEGMIDLVCYRKETKLTVVDHKTQSRYDEIYPYNHQCMNYLTFTGADYFLYNYIGLQDKQNENTFHRQPFRPPPDFLPQWKRDVKNTFDEMSRYAEAIESGEMGGEAYPRRRHACDSGKYGTCQFYQICKVPDDSKWLPVVMSNYVEKAERWKAWA